MIIVLVSAQYKCKQNWRQAQWVLSLWLLLHIPLKAVNLSYILSEVFIHVLFVSLLWAVLSGPENRDGEGITQEHMWQWKGNYFETESRLHVKQKRSNLQINTEGNPTGVMTPSLLMFLICIKDTDRETSCKYIRFTEIQYEREH